LGGVCLYRAAATRLTEAMGRDEANKVLEPSPDGPVRARNAERLCSGSAEAWLGLTRGHGLDERLARDLSSQSALRKRSPKATPSPSSSVFAQIQATRATSTATSRGMTAEARRTALTASVPPFSTTRALLPTPVAPRTPKRQGDRNGRPDPLHCVSEGNGRRGTRRSLPSPAAISAMR
jgi:hypothetical protein